MRYRNILGLLIIISLFTITGCTKKEEPEKKNIITNGDSAVIYFSATGTTEKIAQRIAEYSKSDLIEIIPKEEYTKQDLDYNKDCRANKEQSDSEARPEIKNQIDISTYNTIYLGYPIWWGTNPKIILTLLDTYDFTNKTIIPFCTSGSTDISGSVIDLRNYNTNLTIKDGKRFSANDSDEIIQTFINQYNEVKNEMKVVIQNEEYRIELEDNDTVKQLLNIIPLELKMNELNGNEKYVYLKNPLPTNASIPEKINKGDVMLFGDNCLVIFYKSFETEYSYTKIGHIENLPDLGKDSITIELK